MRRFYLLLLLIFIFSTAVAQYSPVIFNYQKSYFNEGDPLPAEQKFIVYGDIPSNVAMVELNIYKPKGDFSDPIYQAGWKRAFNENASQFHVPVDYKLRSSEEYDFQVNFFEIAGKEAKKELLNRISDHLKNYLYQSVRRKGKKIVFNQNPNNVLDNINKIVRADMEYYRSFDNQPFEGFSLIISSSIKNLQKAKFKNQLLDNSQDTTLQLKEKITINKLDKILELMRGELAHFLDQKTYKVLDVKKVPLYPTEKTRTTLAVNVGYGGVYLDGNFDNLSYGVAPYVGLSLPLGNKAFRSAFLSNTSISAGLFLQNFETNDGVDYTGPVVGLPFYAGLGYKIYDFIRLNAGATLLQEGNINGTNNFSTGNILVKPYIGLTAEINLWVGLNK